MKYVLFLVLILSATFTLAGDGVTGSIDITTGTMFISEFRIANQFPPKPKPVITFYDETNKQVGEFDFSVSSAPVFTGDLEKSMEAMRFDYWYGLLRFIEWYRQQNEKGDE